jgi:hypothetical protein
LAAILALGLSTEAPGAVASTPGITLDQACRGAAPHACLSYIAGVMDLHQEALAPQTAPMFCPPAEVDLKQVARGVALWFQQHPEMRDAPAVLGVTSALALLYPCE